MISANGIMKRNSTVFEIPIAIPAAIFDPWGAG
jgi:hypothetical protein